ncbi:MAG: replicative DNA helicase [Gemmatimonadaceae bacterium]|nr:replicative DNA helicase [Gemmatimonadaceae bacterium]
MTQPPNGREGQPQGQRLDRMPPQAVEVEQAVLGAMLIEPRAVGRAIELLEEEVFYHGPHARIFAAMVELWERNEAVDQLTVGEELKRRGQLEPAGGVVYLAELAAGVASAANIEHHARIVVERGLSRGLIEASAEISNRAFEGRSDVHELIDWAEQRIFALSERGLTQGFEPIEQVLGETIQQLEQAQKNRSAVSGVDTGYKALNEITSGFQYGDLILLAARPSVGKSALALCCASRAAMQHGRSVAVFTLEMSKQQVAQRLLSIETRFNLHRLRTGHLGQEDWVHVTRQVTRLAQARIYVDDTAGISVLEARAKARRLKREHGVDLVIIDYLQLMGSHESLQSREQEVSRISRGLKAMAKELDVPVLALSQLSRAPEARTDRRPQLSDLRESGSLEQDADVVMFIYRPDMYGLKSEDGEPQEGKAEIIVAKQRNGPTDSAELMWNKESASFEDLAPGYRIDEEEVEGYAP